MEDMLLVNLYIFLLLSSIAWLESPLLSKIKTKAL